MTTPMLTIIGCGNLNRSDDGVGVVVAQRLQHALNETPALNVRIFDCGTAGIEVMFQARGSRELIIIDASQIGSEPGAVYEVPGRVLEQLHTPSYNLHDFRWDHAIAAGRKIFKHTFPTKATVYLIEAQTLDFGWTLSPAVEIAAEKVFQSIRQKIAASDIDSAPHPMSPTPPLTLSSSLHPK